MQFSGKLRKMWKNIEILKYFITKRRRNYLVLEANNHTTKFFTKNLLAIKMKITKILMNNPVYLRLSMLELSKYEYVWVWCMSSGMII